ncbi:MAG TPA: LanC-like protein [Polyangiaceae bacterium]|nr:LanC-like protein [Polyangiaceae bacterium]
MLLRGHSLLEPADQARCQEVIETTIYRTAVVENDSATWPTELGENWHRSKRLMQFCHGAPGFVVCLARLPGTAADDLLAAAGEATWRAGPLRQGSNLCHGTAGNGYAFLVLYARTGEARWLARARAFAMHAIAQCDAEAAAIGRPRHSLWTGDIGLALYLRDCVRSRAEFPTLDVF